MYELRLGAVALDCDDPMVLANFWSTLLNSRVVFANDRFAAINTGSLWLTMHKVPNHQPPSWPEGESPKQLHLDIGCEDLDAAEAMAVGLGAQIADLQPAPHMWRVLIDPAGHPFCVSTQVPD